MSLRFALLAAMTATAAAKCPAGCSGHGTCGLGEVCKCEDGYSALDCSNRQCPFGVSWTIADADAGITPGGRGLGGTHPYTECSSQGDCDYSTGTCKCNPGFSGKGCRRRDCYNDCSGHGKCYNNMEFRANFTALNGAVFNSQFRDFLSTRQCVCDRGFSGVDCSERLCPKGDDPVTDCTTDATGAAHEQIQRITVKTATLVRGTCTTGGLNSPTAGGHYECNHAGGVHTHCTDSTRWYGNEAFSQDGKGISGGGLNVYDDCASNLGFHLTTTAAENVLGGYIALKYTDMFGGIYKTRPILIDNQNSAHQFLGSTGAVGNTYSFSKPDAAAQAWQQYGGLGAPKTLRADGVTLSGSDVRGDVLKAIHQDGSAADTTTQYDQLRNGRMLYVADRIRDALQGLPNFAIPSVNVTNYYIDRADVKTMFTNVFDVTFTHHTNSGKQNLMECIYDHVNACEGAFPRLYNSGMSGSTTNQAATLNACTTTGNCNTKYVGKVASFNTVSCNVEEVHPGTKSYEENASCSNRGTCDTSTGTCTCYEGHTGEACSQQTVFF